MAFDDLFQYVGGVGVYQIIMLVFLGFMPFIEAFNAILMVFLGPDHDHWCKIDRLANFSYPQQKYIGIPYNEENAAYERCLFYDLPYSDLTDEQLWNWNWTRIENGSVAIRKCESSWIYDQSEFISSITSKFNLVCDDSNLLPLAASLHFVGYALSSIIAGPMSDLFGRRTIILSASVVQAPLSIAASYVSNYSSFCVIRFILGGLGCMLSQTGFVFMMEIFGAKYRAIPGTLYWSNWCLGMISLPVIAYFIRDFEKLNITMSCFGFVALSFFVILPESPRWLVTNGKFEQAEIVIRDMADVNKRLLPDDISSIIRSCEHGGEDKTNTNLCAKITTLCKSSILLKRILLIIPAWISNALIYYGLSLNTGSVKGSLYTVTFLSGLVEIPAYVALFFLLMNCSRKLTVLSSTVSAAGICLLCIPFIGTELAWMITMLTLIGKGLITLSWGTLESYTLELFPTVVRQLCYGFINLCSSIGSLTAPYTGPPMMEIWTPLPLVIFGIIGILSALLLLFLPDTFQKDMPDIIEDVHKKNDRDIANIVPEIFSIENLENGTKSRNYTCTRV